MFNFLALLDIRVLTTIASDWPRTFFIARLCLFSIIITKIIALTKFIVLTFRVTYGYTTETHRTQKCGAHYNSIITQH